MNRPSILAVLTDVFGDRFSGPSWFGWRAALAALFGLPPENAVAADLIRECTGRQSTPNAPAREGWWICGRRAGKTIAAALITIYLSCFMRYTLMPGEVGVVLLMAADKRQARILLSYIGGLMRSVPMLAALIANETAETIELTNGIVIEVCAASFRGTRGRTCVAVLLDEVAFFRSDESANPDTEILNAVRPSLATTGGILLALSSPYARKGELYKNFTRHFGKDDDPVLVWRAATTVMNPTVPQRVIDEAMAEDEARARAEYGAEFRSDVESFISREAIDAVVAPGRRELPHVGGTAYRAFFDAAGGSGTDSMTVAIAHGGVLDLIREARPPFSPEQVVAEFAATLKGYRIGEVVGDRYAGEWPREALRKHGIGYQTSERAKSEIYRDVLPLINSERVELLDHPRLIAQLAGLERRTARGGRDSIDHAPGSHDDVANAVAGVLTLNNAHVIRVRGFQPTTELERSRAASRIASNQRAA